MEVVTLNFKLQTFLFKESGHMTSQVGLIDQHASYNASSNICFKETCEGKITM